MMTETRVRLQDADQQRPPPAWAAGEQPTGRFWYHVNQHGEQWVARVDGDAVVFAGLDAGWHEIRATLADVFGVREVVRRFPIPASPLITLGGLILSGDEALWVAAVLEAAQPALEAAYRRAS